ncbi:hypothetical protein AB4Z17_08510 [Paenibacillus sp. TAF43_2]|uniref:hypothetical protein n=1 Tax=Paenibacillus sp. TAF43_2 TaxID=3233069 RepID=UPI003F9C19A0
MKNSIRGEIHTVDGALIIIAEINKYQLWRLITAEIMDDMGANNFTFEAWVNNEADKTALFDNLKLYVDKWGGWIDWHQCTHDEPTAQPCVIEEEYRR